MTGSLAACPKPRTKKILSLFESLQKIAGDATMVYGLPLPRYINKKCCLNNGHIENFSNNDYAEVFGQASKAARACLEATFPSAIIFDQLSTISSEDKDVVFKELLSSASLPIWSKGDHVQLTNKAYGDEAATLVSKLNSLSGDHQRSTTRKRIESVVTRVQTPTKSAPTPGWILGDCAGPQRGRGGPGRGFGSGMGRGGRHSMLPGWRGTGVNRWNPY